MKKEVSDRKDYDRVIDAFLSGVNVNEMSFHAADVQEVLRDALRCSTSARPATAAPPIEQPGKLLILKS